MGLTLTALFKAVTMPVLLITTGPVSTLDPAQQVLHQPPQHVQHSQNTPYYLLYHSPILHSLLLMSTIRQKTLQRLLAETAAR